MQARTRAVHKVTTAPPPHPNEGPPTAPLVSTKIGPPRVPGRLIYRPRLVQLLTLAIEERVTAIIAPAGWGKTLLMSSWLSEAELPGPVAWLSLDTGDNDPIRFWSNLLQALHTATSARFDNGLDTLLPPITTSSELGSFVALLVNALAELPSPVIVVLDDVHELTNQPLVDQLDFLLQFAPRQLRIVLAGRFLPPLSLARMRVARELTEIRANDLGFTEREASALLEDVGLRLSASDMNKLHVRAEGWPAGLRLAALSMANVSDPAGFVTHFVGDEGTVADYLIAEVFEKQSAETRDFLLRTSVCERMTGGLANALTGRSDGAAMLAQMERGNVFTIALGPERFWYRYHSLFGELLRRKLEQGDPELLPRLHRTASAWFAENGVPLEAFHHAVESRDWALASATLTKAWLPLFLDGEYSNLRAMLTRIPNDKVDSDPVLAAIRAVTRLALDDVTHADRDALLAEEMSGTASAEQSPQFDIAIAMFHLDRARLRGDVAEARAASSVLLGSPGTAPRVLVSDDVRAAALLHLGATEYWSGSREVAERRLREGLTLARRTGRDYVELCCLSELTAVLAAQYRLGEAASLAQQAAKLAERRGWTNTEAMALAWHALGYCHYVWNELDEADKYLDLAEDAVRTSESALQTSIRFTQGMVLSLRGDTVGAIVALGGAAESLESMTGKYIFSEYVRGETIRLLAAIGEIDRAKALLSELTNPEPWPTHLLVAKAQLQLAQADTAGALKTLDPAVNGTSEGFTDERVQALLMAAAIHRENGRSEEASRLTEAALDLSEPERICYAYLQLGHRGQALLSEHARQPTMHPRFLGELIAMLGDAFADGSSKTPSGDRSSLTDREVTVLRYLPSLLTSPEIAAELFVSVNTVKAHLKSIYGKLAVSSRRQAVLRARELGLL